MLILTMFSHLGTFINIFDARCSKSCFKHRDKVKKKKKKPISVNINYEKSLFFDNFP